MIDLVLTRDEMVEAQGKSARVDDNTRAIGLATVKKAFRWGCQKCLDHHTSMNNVRHFDCNECWREIIKALEEG